MYAGYQMYLNTYSTHGTIQNPGILITINYQNAVI